MNINIIKPSELAINQILHPEYEMRKSYGKPTRRKKITHTTQKLTFQSGTY